MKTQTAALWLIAIGSAGVCSGVKLEDARPFKNAKVLWRREGKGGSEDTEPLLSFQVPNAGENEEEGEAPLGEEVVDTTPLDTTIRSTLARVKGFFNRTALRRKAQIAQDLNLFAFTLQAKDCFLRKLQLPLTHPMISRKVKGQLEPQVDPMPLPSITHNDLHFNNRWEYLEALRAIFITDFPTSSAIVREVQNEMKQIALKATKVGVKENDRLFWKAWLLFIKAMQVRPHADPMLTAGPISKDTTFYSGGNLESASEAEETALYKLIQEETHANVTFILEGADKVNTKIVNFIAKSRVGRALIASLVSRILRYAGSLRDEQREEKEGPEPRRYKLLESKLLLKATAEIESIVRQMYTYVMSGKKPLALVHKNVIYKVLLHELQEAAKRREPRQSLRQRSKRFFGFGRGQSSLQVENTSALMPVHAHGAMVKNASSSTPLRMEASFVQSDKDEGSPKRNALLIAGATFVFVGIAVLGSMTTGALGIGLIVAGIVAMLLSIVGKVVGLLTGTIETFPSGHSEPLVPPAQTPREPEEAQPHQKPREPEEKELPQETEGPTKIGPDEKSN
ncbi:hypothetical protein Emed_006230 [Eimeria media]